MDQVAVDVEEDSAVKLLVNDMGLEDLVVEGLGCPLGDRHGDLCDANCWGVVWCLHSQKVKLGLGKRRAVGTVGCLCCLCVFEYRQLA